MKIIKQGAESVIYLDKNVIIKDRIKKNYRINEIDEKLRKYRTRSETKLLMKTGINVFESDDKGMKIRMEYVKGELLKDVFNSLRNKKEICYLIGKKIKNIHDKNIIHGDLTISNIILRDNKIYLIDFGLGYVSDKTEDKAVDLYLLKQVFKSEYEDFNVLFEWVLESYGDKEVADRLERVEKRGRYKSKLLLKKG